MTAPAARNTSCLYPLWRLAVKGENANANLLTKAAPHALLSTLENDN